MFGLRKKFRCYLFAKKVRHTIEVLKTIDKVEQLKGMNHSARRSLKIIRRELERTSPAIIDVLNDVLKEILGPSDGVAV